MPIVNKVLLPLKGSRHSVEKASRVGKLIRLLLCLSLSFFIENISAAKEHTAWKGRKLSTQITLADWGVKHPREIAYVALTVQHFKNKPKIMVQEIRTRPPRLLTPVQVRTFSPALEKGAFLIDDFQSGNINHLGGYFNEFVRAPSRAGVMLDRFSDGHPALTLIYDNRPPGFSGFWIHLFETKKPPCSRAYLDARHVGFITFQIRGSKGGEDLALKVADRAWEEKGDALLIGSVGDFLKRGQITTSWQRAWVPLSRLPQGINPKELAVLSFAAEGKKKGQVFLRNLALTSHKKQLIVTHRPAKQTKRSLQKALWLWTTENIISHSKHVKSLIDFCISEGITVLFAQLPYRAEQKGHSWRITIDQSRLSSFVASLHKAGIQVDALDGDPHYALTEHHEKIVAVVKRLVDYQQKVSAKARFRGVRFDIEPYLLPSFGGIHKQSILSQYLTLLKKIRKLTEPAGLTLGADIPFWFDATNNYFEPLAEINGRPVSDCILDAVDNLALMDYRTKAYGPDGVIAHGEGELKYAAKLGKPVYIGIETVALPDETVLEFALEGKGVHLIMNKFDGKTVTLYLLTEDEWTKAKATISKEAVLVQTSAAWAPADKVTFVNRSVKDLADVVRQASTELMVWPSFTGFAIHSYESYRPWLKGQHLRF